MGRGVLLEMFGWVGFICDNNVDVGWCGWLVGVGVLGWGVRERVCLCVGVFVGECG